jgi:thiamine-monophosphate kinase
MNSAPPPFGPGGEFDLIRHFLEGVPPPPASVRVAAGDDAAVLDGGWVLSTDLSIEDVHFRRSWLDDREIGYRACAAALSDLAAMAADATGVFVSLAVPRGGAVDAEAVMAGVREAGAELGAALLGGDSSRSPGPLMLDVVALGRADWPVLRNGAEPGDDLWVTGALGASAAAVHAWREGREPSEAARRSFARPTPRLAEACFLAERELVDAMIDLSDGLAGDAGHLAAASGVRIEIEAALVPVASTALEEFGAEDALRAALHGGEDYELCFVTDPDVLDAADFERRMGTAVTRVGRVKEGSGVWIVRDGLAPERAADGGYDHFEEGGA